jgi:hypothetical protein
MTDGQGATIATVEVVRREYAQRSQWRLVRETVSYPAECALHFDVNQRTLRIIDRSGSVLAAFTGLWRIVTEREMTEVHNLISITLRATNAPAEMRAELEAVKLKLAQLITELNFAFSPPSFTGALIRGVRDDLRTEEIGHQRMAP